MQRLLHAALMSACLLSVLCLAPRTHGSPATVAQAKKAKYVVLAWNDLGMHCISPRFNEMAILPPYNTLQAIVIRRGDEPDLVKSGVTLHYSFPNNTTVKGKTDFWTYAPELFGTNLPLGRGLTGNSVKGTFKRVGDHYEATGIPALPIGDNGVWNPYQKAIVTMVTKGATLRATVTVPVSDEMNCAKCHTAGGVAAENINAGTVEGNILTLHDQEHATNLMDSRPVLCASCHSDNALGAPGTPGVPSLSLAMHVKHALVDQQPGCYDCHPGARTQCNRSLNHGMGPVTWAGRDPRCDDCHGTLTEMAQDLMNGRQPWLQEPKCSQCHGPHHDTGKTLYRNAKGHGGVYCIACHGSPHAWYPSSRREDNSQPFYLMNNAHPIGYNACYVCHTGSRKGTKPPHNIRGDD